VQGPEPVKDLCLASTLGDAAVGIVVAGAAAAGIVVAAVLGAVAVAHAHRLGIIGGGVVVAVGIAIAVGGAVGGGNIFGAALIYACPHDNFDRIRAFAGLAFSRSDGALRARQARRVTGMARKLAAVASRLLPASDRARYLEEYRSELWDLAAGGGGSCQQAGYATRQVLSAVPLRFAVLASRQQAGRPRPGDHLGESARPG
jgi:hypothetical protein